MTHSAVIKRLLLWSLLPPIGASAQSIPDSTKVVPLAEVIVEGRRAPSPVHGRELLGVGSAPGASLAAIFAARLGVYVHGQGPGAPATPRIRGWDGSQTSLVLDGITLTNPQSGQVDLSIMPTSFLESATLELGPGSAQGGLGGVIRLTTIAPRPGGTLRLEASRGPFGIRRTAVAVGLAGQSLGGLVAMDAARFAQNYRTGSGATRPSDGGDRISLLGKVFYQGSSGRWTGQWFSSHSGTGLPGPANGRPRNASQDQDITQGQVALRRASSTRVTDLSLVAQESRGRFEDRDSGAISSSRTRSIQASANVTDKQWAVNGSVAREWMPVQSQSQLAVRIDAHRDWTLRQDGPLLTLGFGQEIIAGKYFAIPRVGLLHTIGPVETSISGGRTVRHPSFVERFWVPGGNANLQPEAGWGVEANLAGSMGSARVEVTGFLARLTNRIVWHPSLVSAGLQVWSPINVGRSVSRGVEARLALGDDRRGLTLEGTWTSATDRTDEKAASFGHQLRYAPRLVAAGEGWISVRGVVLTSSVKRTGRRPIASDGSFFEPAFTVADATLSRSATALGLSHLLSVSVANLLDADYAAVRLYPMPGRHLTLTLRIDLP